MINENLKNQIAAFGNNDILECNLIEEIDSSLGLLNLSTKIIESKELLMSTMIKDEWTLKQSRKFIQALDDASYIFNLMRMMKDEKERRERLQAA